MRRFYVIAAALAVYLAGCSDKTGPVAVETTVLQREDLYGMWGGSLIDKSVEIDVKKGQQVNSDSLYMAISFMDYGYSLLFRYMYDGGVINYSESGEWICDERNPGQLSFNIGQGHLYRYLLNDFIYNEESFGPESGRYSAWKSDFEYYPGALRELKYENATLRLFNISGRFNFAEFTLLKR
ncbi:MAG: hypothetical protein A3F83_10360 [Candidatus Glassbacteria bacterium RIFCSPLOWO2_12_FULL_58_11]|uniref:Uncharacterized protein n=2 Tax=Candidatus Glassiibacteriota TaxID=1817805 RepID=A0A1F5YYZ1_9BACT|nr:MAG: hypothetical protein A2Z86_09405 [Candidatus Glassbacteria bacterium GWA2_58_10]OGG05122.1 MAG: hypothetical protein A3F83_10360 [Candidatus Glassbacteria bacterium RIFCSPLOWO2_12_FULL_58_11]